MSDLKEYTEYFSKFQDDFIRFKTGKDKYEKCKGCGRFKDYTNEQGLPLKILQPLLDESHSIGDLNSQESDVNRATSELQALREKCIKDNDLSDKNTMIQDIAKERLKNSIEKAQIMQRLTDDDTPAIERKELRAKYAQIISDEKKDIIPRIKELRIQRTPLLMMDAPNIVKHA